MNGEALQSALETSRNAQELFKAVFFLDLLCPTIEFRPSKLRSVDILLGSWTSMQQAFGIGPFFESISRVPIQAKTTQRKPHMASACAKSV